MKRADPRQRDHGHRTGRFCLAVLITALFLIGINGLLYGQNPSDPPVDRGSSKKRDRIHVSADSLMVDSGDNTAEFKGNVRVVQKNLIITADGIKILFHADITVENSGAMDESAFKQIVARGHVTLIFDNKTALADQAVYHTEKQVLVLSGENTKVMMGENSITGTRITLYRADGRIEVEGNGKTRVEGVFFSEITEREQSKDGKPAS